MLKLDMLLNRPLIFSLQLVAYLATRISGIAQHCVSTNFRSAPRHAQFVCSCAMLHQFEKHMTVRSWFQFAIGTTPLRPGGQQPYNGAHREAVAGRSS